MRKKLGNKKLGKKTVVGIICVIILGVFLGNSIMSRDSGSFSFNDPNMVSVVEERELSKSISFTGKVESVTKDIIRTELTNAKVSKIYVRKGDYVKKGDIIADFDVQFLREQIQEISESNRISEKTRKNLKQNAEENLQSLIDKKKAELDNLGLQKQIMQERKTKLAESYDSCMQKILIRKNNRQDTYDLEQKLLSYQMNILSCEEQLKSYKQQSKDIIQEYNAKIGAAKSELEKIDLKSGAVGQKERERLEKMLSDSSVKAGKDGMVTSLLAEEGMFCEDGMVAEVQQPDNMQIVGYIKTANLNKIEKGMNVDICTVATGNHKLNGTIKEVSDVGEDKGFKVIISLNDDTYNLKVNMDATVVVYVEKKDNCLSVPYDSIVKEDDGASYVYKLNPINEGEYEIEKKRVTIGMDSYYYTEISGDGIERGDYLIQDPSWFCEHKKIKLGAGA